jgi:ABC-type molybdate transport system substrate-binding protein
MQMTLKEFAAMVAVCVLANAGAAHGASVEIFSAGSLRNVVGDLSKEAGPVLGVEVKGQFGGSGTMRERIEKGEKPDLFLSADMNSPRKLEALGRTVIPVVAFARNRECIVSRRSLGLTPENMVNKFLDKDVRLMTGTPIVDPSGDYGFAILDKIDAVHPGAGNVLKDKANSVMGATATPSTPGQSPMAALFEAHKIDIAITYCSGGLEKELPNDLVSFPTPAAFDPHPVYGIAVLTAKPEALRLALYLLSDKGQAIIQKNGLVPLLDRP